MSAQTITCTTEKVGFVQLDIQKFKKDPGYPFFVANNFYLCSWKRRTTVFFWIAVNRSYVALRHVTELYIRI